MTKSLDDYFNNDNSKQVNIILECPECFERNEVEFSTELKCKKCEKTLSGISYQKILPTSFLLLTLTAFTGVVIDDEIHVYRPSVKTEYKMMKTCINEFQDKDLNKDYKYVRNICFCAVESMSGILDAEKARTYSEQKLKDLLKNNFDECKN